MDNLKQLREERAMSQRDLARLSGVAQDTISRLERGGQKIRPSTRRKLSDALGVDSFQDTTSNLVEAADEVVNFFLDTGDVWDPRGQKLLKELMFALESVRRSSCK